VKLIDLTYVCNSLTNYENEGHEKKLCEPAKNLLGKICEIPADEFVFGGF
jgi:hypothetical protein